MREKVQHLVMQAPYQVRGRLHPLPREKELAESPPQSDEVLKT